MIGSRPTPRSAAERARRSDVVARLVLETLEGMNPRAGPGDLGARPFPLRTPCLPVMDLLRRTGPYALATMTHATAHRALLVAGFDEDPWPKGGHAVHTDVGVVRLKLDPAREIVAELHLSPKVVMRANRIDVRGRMPDSVLARMTERRLGDVVETPARLRLETTRIIKAENGATATRITLDVDPSPLFPGEFLTAYAETMPKEEECRTNG